MAEHNKLVVPGDARLVQIFPHAVPLPTGQLLLPHEPTETRILRNLGFAVPSPILSSYTWCNSPTFNAQRITAAMLVVEPRAFVLSTMGTGKTRAVLFAFDWLRKHRLVRKMVVVAPLSTLNFTWAREIMQVMPHYRVGIVYGSRERREKVLRDKTFDIYIINHDGVSTVADVISTIPGLDVLCLDEAAVYRRATTKKWKVMRKLVDSFAFVWGLTGTPTPREPIDAFGIIKLINPKLFPYSYTAFRDQLMVKVSQFKWVPRKGADKKVFELMQPAVRFTMADCMDMPPVTYTDHEVKLAPKQQLVYDTLRKHCRMIWHTTEINAANGGVLLNKLLQVSSGCVYDDNHSAIILDGSNRLDVAGELVEENDRKTIIFVPYIPLVKYVSDYLRKAGCIVHEISGATKPDERNRIFRHFQDVAVDTYTSEVIVAHPKTMSHGLTLTAANMIIWYAPISDLEIYEQANARIVRPGQDSNHVSIQHLVGSKMEQLAYKKLVQRQRVQGALLELFEEED